MRRVLRDRHEVAHYWANQRQSEGRAGNVYFSGDTIYSYGSHFPMATLYRHPNTGELVAAFTSRRSSVSTNSHLSIARRAASHIRKITVIHPDDSALSQLRLTLQEVEAQLDKASRARQRKAGYLSMADSIASDFNAYAELRGESVRIADVRLEGVREQIEAAEIELRRREAEVNAKREAAQAEGIAEWLAGKRAYCPYTATPRLRISDDLIETSWHASITVADAKRLWPVIQRVMSGERDYEVGMELGGWQLTKIRRDGSIVVGCHDIAYSEIERIAQQLGLLEEVAA